MWAAVHTKAPQELKDAMALAYLISKRPADVLMMRKDAVEGCKHLRIRANLGVGS